MYVRKNIGAKGRIYLTIVHGYRDVNGIPMIIQLNILKMLLNKTIEYANERKIEFEISKNNKLESNVQYRKNLGYSVIKKIYNELDIGTFFKLLLLQIEVLILVIIHI